MDMKNFAVGPVTSDEDILAIGAEQVPYFRTTEFSAVMLENEKLMLKFMKAPEKSRVVFLTGSGTAAMEAAVINSLTKEDKALVVDGGSFGHRFCEILTIHGIPFDRITLSVGEGLTREKLFAYSGKEYTALLVNGCETSTGVKFDIDLIGEFCRDNGAFYILDAVSMFIADQIDMAATGADIVITGSQKALACPPGVSIAALSPRAVERAYRINPGCMYLSFALALTNGERGQTPFTPAVGTLLQINAKLKQIEERGGIEAETAHVAALAAYFREKISDFPFEFATDSPSNAVTSLHPLTAPAYKIFTVLKDEYGIWICPNGGELKDKIFRVGHLGALTKEDYDGLIAAFADLKKREII